MELLEDFEVEYTLVNKRKIIIENEEMIKKKIALVRKELKQHRAQVMREKLGSLSY